MHDEKTPVEVHVTTPQCGHDAPSTAWSVAVPYIVFGSPKGSPSGWITFSTINCWTARNALTRATEEGFLPPQPGWESIFIG